MDNLDKIFSVAKIIDDESDKRYSFFGSKLVLKLILAKPIRKTGQIYVNSIDFSIFIGELIDVNKFWEGIFRNLFYIFAFESIRLKDESV